MSRTFDLEQAISLYQSGSSLEEIGEQIGWGVTSVWKRLKAHVTFRPCHKTGRDHWNWQGGKAAITSPYTSDNPTYREWKLAVHTRDAHICQLCGAGRSKGMHAHHIKRKSKYPALAFVTSNGISLCKRCHCKLVNGLEHVWEPIFELAIEAGQPVPYSIFVWFNEVVMDKTAQRCACGCGGFTNWVKGKYKTFCHGHHRRGVPMNAAQKAAVASTVFKPMDPTIVAQIIPLLGTMPQRAIAAHLGVSQGFVSKVALGDVELAPAEPITTT